MTAAPHTGPIVETAPLERVWHGEDDTAAFARQLAAQPGIGNAFVTLHGDLGAGKTTLVRHLLRALGVQGRVKSPTYAVVEPHEAPGIAIWHFDFYRFDDPREWEDAGTHPSGCRVAVTTHTVMVGRPLRQSPREIRS